MSEIRFLLDEHNGRAIAGGLKRRGIDAIMTTEAGLRTHHDFEYLQAGQEMGRVVFTQDRDFVDLHFAAVPHAGIVFCLMGTRSIGEIVRFLSLVHSVMTGEEMVNRLERF